MTFDPRKEYTNHLSVLIDAVGHEGMEKVKSALSLSGYTIHKGDPMKLPNNDTAPEMLEATRAELRRATAKIMRLEDEKADLTVMVLRYLNRAEIAEQKLKEKS